MAAGEAEEESLVGRLIIRLISAKEGVRKFRMASLGTNMQGSCQLSGMISRGTCIWRCLTSGLGRNWTRQVLAFLAKPRELSDAVIREARLAQHFDVDGRGECVCRTGLTLRKCKARLLY